MRIIINWRNKIKKRIMRNSLLYLKICITQLLRNALAGRALVTQSLSLVKLISPISWKVQLLQWARGVQCTAFSLMCPVTCVMRSSEVKLLKLEGNQRWRGLAALISPSKHRKILVKWRLMMVQHWVFIPWQDTSKLYLFPMSSAWLGMLGPLHWFIGWSNH